MPILYKEDKPRLEQEIKGRGGAREFQLRSDIDAFPYEGNEQQQVEYLRTHPVLLRFLQGDEQRGQEAERQQQQQQRRPARNQPTPRVSATSYSEPSFDLTQIQDHPLASVGQWAQDANPMPWQQRSPGGQGPSPQGLPPSGGMMPGRGPMPPQGGTPSPRPMLGPEPRPDMGAPPPSGGFTPGQNQDPWLESMRRSRGGRRY